MYLPNCNLAPSLNFDCCVRLHGSWLYVARTDSTFWLQSEEKLIGSTLIR